MPEFGEWASRWWMPVLFVVIAGHLTNVCVTLFLHRAQTHRGVRLHASPRCRCASGCGSPRRSSPRNGSPAIGSTTRSPTAKAIRISPLVEGLRNIVLKGAFYYRKAVRQPGMLEKYGKGTPNDWIERHLLTPLNWLGILVMLAHRHLPVRLLRRPARVGRADDLDPVLGRRRHQRHRPRARLPQLRGEGREPEHLADRHLARRRGAAQQPPRRPEVSAKFKAKWFEFDIGWVYIRMLQLVRPREGRVRSQLRLRRPAPRRARCGRGSLTSRRLRRRDRLSVIGSRRAHQSRLACPLWFRARLPQTVHREPTTAFAV